MLARMNVIPKKSFCLVSLIAIVVTSLLVGCATSEVRQNRAELRAYAKEVDLNNLNAAEKQFLEDYKDREMSADDSEYLKRTFGDKDPKSLTDAELIAIRRAIEEAAARSGR